MPAPSTRSVVGPLYGAGGALLTNYTLVFRRSGDLQQVDGEAVAPTFTPSAYVQQVVTDGTTADFAVTLVLGRYDLQFTGPTGAYGTVQISVDAGSGSLSLADTLDGPTEEVVNILSQAIAARDKAQEWAESAGEPGGAGTKSAKSWAAEAEATAETLGDLAELEALVDRSETAEDGAVAAAASIGMFSNTTLAAAITAGLAVATEGQTFHATGDDVDYIGVYKDLSGVAVEQARYPSSALVQEVVDRLPLNAPVGYAWSVYDGNDFAAVGVLDDGTFVADEADLTELSTEELTIASTTLLDEEYVGYSIVLGADASGAAAVGIKDDGTLSAIAIEAVTMNGMPAPAPANRFGGAYPYQIGFINNTGESLAEGSTGTAITTSQEYDNICWPARTSTGGAFLPSTIANGQFAARGENPMFGAQSGWKQLIRDENGLRYQDNDFKLLACNNGYSGYKIAQISKGQAPFTAMIAQATALQAYSAATGKTVGWLCNVLTIGANDGDPGSLTPTATFKSETLTLAADLDTDVRAIITSQTRRVLTIINQLSSRAPQLAVAQLECSQESPLIVLAGPMYQYTYYDALHIDPASERAMGALCGLVSKRVITDGVSWEPLQPLSHVQVGASIYLRMNRSGLTFDASTLPAQTRFGFDCLDGSAATVAQSADPEIVGRDTIKLTFASEAVASTVAKIRAGHNASTGRADSFVGGSTNLRVSNSLLTFDALPVYDWCAIFSYSI